VELRHLRYFVAVAEELHFGRAARRLRMSQPPLSQQIRRLETELGVGLFHRTKRRVALTESGRTLLDDARALLLHAELAAQAARRSQRAEVHHLAVGFVPWADFSVVPGILRAFRRRHAAVHLQVLELNEIDQIAALREHRLHAGFLRTPVQDMNLGTAPVFAEPLIVVFPQGHHFEAFRRVPVKDLADEPHVFVPRQRAPVYHDLVMRFCRDMGFTLRVRHEAEHPHGVLSLVAAGLGISIVPMSAGVIVRSGLRHRPLDPAGPQLELSVAWRQGQQSPALRAFLDVARATTRAAARRRSSPGRD
jgi:DNA-binding transcriptional LysR family regulator